MNGERNPLLDDDRRRMLEMHLEARGITDPAVLAAMAAVPREAFVERHSRSEAYQDRPLPIGDGQTISQPYIVALMAQELHLRPGDRVLDVGTGSGYAAAVMDEITGAVWSIERHRRLAETAREHLRLTGHGHVDVVVGDGTLGHRPAAPFDAICVAASAPSVPAPLLEQLADGGRLVMPVGDPSGVQRLVRLTRRGDTINEESLLDVRFVPLVDDSADLPDAAVDP